MTISNYTVEDNLLNTGFWSVGNYTSEWGCGSSLKQWVFRTLLGFAFHFNSLCSKAMILQYVTHINS